MLRNQYHPPLPLHIIHHSPSISSTTPPSYHLPLPLHIIYHSPSISSTTPPAFIHEHRKKIKSFFISSHPNMCVCVCLYVLARKYLYFSSFIFIVGGLISWPHRSSPGFEPSSAQSSHGQVCECVLSLSFRYGGEVVVGLTTKSINNRHLYICLLSREESERYY